LTFGPEEGEVDVQELIRQLAATGIDPYYVWDAIQIEQERASSAKPAEPKEPPERPRPQLRVVAGSRE
jgi:hypothetical protein